MARVKRGRGGGRGAPGPGLVRALPEGALCFAAAAPGAEALLLAELGALGFEGLRPVPGGALFSGGLAAGARACLHSRIASALRLRLLEGPATAFPAALAAYPWRQLFAEAPGPIRVELSGVSKRGPLLQALERALGAPLTTGPGGLYLRQQGPQLTLSVDLAGERLHRRGWRREAGRAPLRETLAAAMLLASGWDRQVPLLDPMCGTGTLPIEAAHMAAERAPGLERAFAFEAWPCLDAAGWEATRAAARARCRPPPGPIFASDRYPGAVGATRRNATRAGVLEALTLSRAAAEALSLPADLPPGVVVANPPYGARLGDRAEALEAHQRLGALMGRLPGWRLSFVSPRPELAEATGLPLREGPVLASGGLRVGLYHFEP